MECDWCGKAFRGSPKHYSTRRVKSAIRRGAPLPKTIPVGGEAVSAFFNSPMRMETAEMVEMLSVNVEGIDGRELAIETMLNQMSNSQWTVCPVCSRKLHKFIKPWWMFW